MGLVAVPNGSDFNHALLSLELWQIAKHKRRKCDGTGVSATSRPLNLTLGLLFEN